MAPRSRPPRRAWRLALPVLGVAACLGSTNSYGPIEDDRAMAVIASAFAAAGSEGLALALCEDLERAAPWTGPTCDLEHVVMGGGRGRAHEQPHDGVECGGCPHEVAAMVQGEASGGPFPSPVALEGFVWLQGPRSGNPYDYPYRLELRCADALAPCGVEGSMDGTGHLELTVVATRSTGPARPPAPDVRRGPASGRARPPPYGSFPPRWIPSARIFL
jgi:hypothetical protein